MAGKITTAETRSSDQRKPAPAGGGDVKPGQKKTADSDTCAPQDAGQSNKDVRVVGIAASAGGPLARQSSIRCPKDGSI